jgi:catechol 2,3-dioxygenase-like lactoylglutathione lyase family enzyme
MPDAPHQDAPNSDAHHKGILDITLGCDDLALAAPFYDAVMGALGLVRLPNPPTGWAGWGDGVGLWLCPPFDGGPATAGNGTMVTLAATSAAMVRAFHLAGLAHGGTDAGSPGTRAAYAPNFYVAYLRDPLGHKIACSFSSYDPAKEQ